MLDNKNARTLVKSLILSSVESYVSSISASSYFGYCLGLDSNSDPLAPSNVQHDFRFNLEPK